MARNRVPEGLNKVVELITKLSLRHTEATILSDMLTMNICCLAHGQMEAEYLETIKKYQQEEMIMFSQILGMLWNRANAPFTDLFGDLYEYLNSKTKAQGLGQFFTPEHICRLMSEMIMTDQKMEDITVNDPCCGSGRQLLAHAKTVLDAGFNPKKNMYYANDLDIICAKMTVVNLAMNGLQGFVTQSNVFLCQRMFFRGGLLRIT